VDLDLVERATPQRAALANASALGFSDAGLSHRPRPPAAVDGPGPGPNLQDLDCMSQPHRHRGLVSASAQLRTHFMPSGYAVMNA
jgi:hypothetical protein